MTEYKTLSEEAQAAMRGEIAQVIYDAMDVADGLDSTAAQRYANAVMSFLIGRERHE